MGKLEWRGCGSVANIYLESFGAFGFYCAESGVAKRPRKGYLSS